MTAALQALGVLATLGAEYERASEERRRAILDDVDRAYRSYKASLAGLPQALAENDHAADAALEALP